VIADSGGKGTVAFVNIPDLPILKAAGEAVTAQLASRADCTLAFYVTCISWLGSQAANQTQVK